MIITKAKKKCRFCERPIEKGHRCYQRDDSNQKRVRASNEQVKAIPNGERKLFVDLSNTRGNRSEISGAILLSQEKSKWHWQFSHVLPKGLYKRFRLYPKNIVLMLPEEHVYVTEHEGEARKNPDWKKYFELKEELKQEYNAQKNI